MDIKKEDVFEWMEEFYNKKNNEKVEIEKREQENSRIENLEKMLKEEQEAKKALEQKIEDLQKDVVKSSQKDNNEEPEPQFTGKGYF